MKEKLNRTIQAIRDGYSVDIESYQEENGKICYMIIVENPYLNNSEDINHIPESGKIVIEVKELHW